MTALPRALLAIIPTDKPGLWGVIIYLKQNDPLSKDLHKRRSWKSVFDFRLEYLDTNTMSSLSPTPRKN